MFDNKKRSFRSVVSRPKRRVRHPRMRPRRRLRHPVSRISPMVIAMSVVLFLCVTGILVPVGLTGAPIEIDEAGCQIDRLPAKSLMVLVDLTDTEPPSDQQMKALESDMARHIESLETGDRFTLAVLAGDGRKPADKQILFSRCRPREEGDWTIEHAPGVERYFRTTWSEPLSGLRAMIDENAGRGAPNTPLMATLIELGRSPLFRASDERHLIVMTDLLEHDPSIDGLSFYRKPTPSYADAAARQLRIADNGGVLDGTTTQLLVLSNPQARAHQSEELFRFWEDWMSAASVAEIAISRI